MDVATAPSKSSADHVRVKSPQGRPRTGLKGRSLQQAQRRPPTALALPVSVRTSRVLCAHGDLRRSAKLSAGARRS